VTGCPKARQSDFKFYLKSLRGMRERPSARTGRIAPGTSAVDVVLETATAAGAIRTGGRCPLFRFSLTRPRDLYAAVP
jgi:hypothetical protein